MGQFLKKKLIKNCAKQCFEVMVETGSENPHFLLRGRITVRLTKSLDNLLS